MSDQDPVDRSQRILDEKTRIDRTHAENVRQLERDTGNAADKDDSAQRIRGNSGVESAARFGELQGGVKMGVHRTFVLKDIYFFESAFRSPLSSNTERLTEFEHSQTRFVNCMLEISIPCEYSGNVVTVTADYRDDNQKELSAESKTFSIEAGLPTLRARFEFGADVPGGWPVGRYVVGIFVNEEKVGDKWFDIVQK